MTIATHNHAEARRVRVFYNQDTLPPYQELLRDMAEWLDPRVGERWLDLGCGAGQLSRLLWQKSQGKVHAIVGVDANAANAKAFADLRAHLRPTPTPMCVRFLARDFALGFADWPSGLFDGVAAGMSLPYAESFSEETHSWNEAAYDRVLAETHRLLKPGGAFVLSVLAPNATLSVTAWHAAAGAFHSRAPMRSLKNAYRMWSCGNWLNRESSRGRFHHLPLETIVGKLRGLGFANIGHRLSYAGQAYVIRCVK